MSTEGEPGMMRAGKADRDKYERGMLIKFSADLRGWGPGDLLLIEGPGGGPLYLHPEAVEGERLYVTASIDPGTHLRFWLDPLDARTAKLDMEDNHVSFLKDYYARA